MVYRKRTRPYFLIHVGLIQQCVFVISTKIQKMEQDRLDFTFSK